MTEYHRTFKRRTFIKTMGGLIVSLPFTSALSISHAAELPDNLIFRVTVSVRDTLNGQQCLDTSTSGYLTVVGPDQTSIDYPIGAGGRLEFLLPTQGTSMLVLNVYGLTSRYWIAEFTNGLLYLKNSDRDDRAIVYNWNAVENCYTIEYFQDNVYVCGPADAGGYFLSQPYQSLSPQTASRIEKIMSKKDNIKYSTEPTIKVGGVGCHPQCTPARCITWGPSCASCTFCRGGSEDKLGIADDSTVSNGSSSAFPIFAYTSLDGCVNAVANQCMEMYGALTGFLSHQQLAENEVVRSFQFRMTVTPSKTALESIQPQSKPLTLPIIDFGLRAFLYSPTGDQISTAYIPMGGTTTTAEGVVIGAQWVDDPTIPHVIINSAWPKSLFEGSAGSYMFAAYVVTTDGQISNKRTEYFASNA